MSPSQKLVPAGTSRYTNLESTYLPIVFLELEAAFKVDVAVKIILGGSFFAVGLFSE